MKRKLVWVMLIGISLAWGVPAISSTAGADLGWNTPLETIEENLTGRTASTIGFIALMIAGAVYAMAGHQRGMGILSAALIGVFFVLGVGIFMANSGVQTALV